eukprot:2906256-Pleurochrysis_carterae.AAC.1
MHRSPRRLHRVMCVPLFAMHAFRAQRTRFARNARVSRATLDSRAFQPRSSTSNLSVAFGGIVGGEPRAPAQAPRRKEARVERTRWEGGGRLVQWAALRRRGACALLN